MPASDFGKQVSITKTKLIDSSSPTHDNPRHYWRLCKSIRYILHQVKGIKR